MSLCLDHEDNQDRSKRVGVMTMCKKINFILVHVLVYCVNFLLMQDMSNIKIIH
jgi:hypothetical protein